MGGAFSAALALSLAGTAADAPQYAPPKMAATAYETFEFIAAYP
jgi:hypothetical protein